MILGQWNPDTEAELRRLIGIGWSFSQVGVRLGFTRAAVSGKVKRLCIRQPNGPTSSRAAVEMVGRISARKGAKPKSVRRPPTPQADLRVAEVTSQNVPLLALTGCKWPTNNPPAGGEHLFCNAHRDPEKPYCEAHMKLAYQGAGPKVKAPFEYTIQLRRAS